MSDSDEGVRAEAEAKLGFEGLESRRDSILQPQRKSFNEFQYTPLQDSSKDIRLCSLIPGLESTNLTVSLRHADLKSTSNAYKCLSYSWGKPNGTPAVINLNDGQCRVWPNLHVLLKRLRSFGIEDELFVDALCINQQDDEEKTAQVELMGEIYSGAQEVLIGLEEASEQEASPSTFQGNVRATIAMLAAGAHLNEVDICDDAFKRVLKSAWFTRCWVVQEVCLAKKATLFGSWGTVPWTEFVQAFRNWYQHRKTCCLSYAETRDEDVSTGCYNVFLAIQNISYTIDNMRNEQHLLRLMLMYQHLSVSDSRDKAFAFRGLHTAKGEPPPPDYSKSKEQIFTELAVWVLKDFSSFMLLGLDLHANESLPSWVPDFSAAPPFNQNNWRSRLACYGTYDCSKDLPWSCEFEAPGTLHVLGLRIDHVQDVARPRISYHTELEHAGLLKEWYAFAGGGLFPLPGIDALDDTFSETIIAGCSRDYTGVRRADAKDLGEWKKILFHWIQDPKPKFHESSAAWVASHMTAVSNRALFRTASGLLGIGPTSMKSSDEVWILPGGRAPVVLARQHGPCASTSRPHTRYTVLGDSYISSESIMYGSAVDPAAQLDPCDLV